MQSYRGERCYQNTLHRYVILIYLFVCLFIFFFSDLVQVLGVGLQDMESPTRSIHLEPTHNKIKTSQRNLLTVTCIP